MSEKPYGFDDDEQTRKLLRSRPPTEALKWTEAVLGDRVVSVRALKGGTSSAMHEIRLTEATVVLRRYVRHDPTEPDIAEREVKALEYVEQIPIPTPELLAADLTSEVPMLLMTRLPGRPDWKPSDVDGWTRRLAEVLPVIHGATLPPAGVIRPFHTYHQQSYDLPRWVKWPHLWHRAMELVAQVPPQAANVFLHRDYHPGNVLWRSGKVTGVVDWQSASIGPPSVDVGHCRSNLYRYGWEVTTKFTSWWEQVSGQQYDPWADLSTIIGCLDELRAESGKNGEIVEEALARALAELR